MLLESLLTCSCACLDRSSDCDSAKGDLSDLNRRAWIQSFQQRFFFNVIRPSLSSDCDSAKFSLI
jgi:hypothetical protein